MSINLSHGYPFSRLSQAIGTNGEPSWRIVINLCLSIEIAEAEDEKFGVVDAVEFSPERLDFGID